MKNMKALIYLRVSTEEQAEKGFSIQVQRMEGINKAVELGCSEQDIFIFSDEGVSGAVLERPQLMAALDMLKKKDSNIKYFICYDSSRLSRNAAHQLIIVDEIKKSSSQLIFIKNSYQDNAEGRFQLTVMAAVDEYERARLKLRTEMGKRAKAGQQKLTHNPGLYGYNFDIKTDTLRINDEHAKNVRQMFSLLNEEHEGPAGIAQKLNDSGIPSPRMKQWSRVTVRRILSNPSYLGILYIRRYDSSDCHLNKFKKTGEKVKVRERPKSEWIPVQIPQIIDKVCWDKAQEILNDTKRMYKKNERTNFLLTSLLKCGICGCMMKGKHIVRDNGNYRYYICSGKYNLNTLQKCDSMLFRADDIEKTVWDCICGSISSYLIGAADIEKIARDYIYDKDNSTNDIFEKKEKTKKEKERIITMFQKGYINEDETEKKLRDIEIRLEHFEEILNKRSEYEARFIERLRENTNYIPYIIEAILKRLDDEGKKHLLGQLVSEITITSGVITIKEGI